MKKFAQLLGTYIETSGVKQTHIASTASISYNYLQRLLAGDRNPSDQVVYKLAHALHLSPEQTGELLASAGFAPPATLQQTATHTKQDNAILPVPITEADQLARLQQQLYRLMQEIPESMQGSFLEEMKHLLSYARYKYVLSGGTSLLNLQTDLSKIDFADVHDGTVQREESCLNIIAQLVGELHVESEEESKSQLEGTSSPPQVVEDMLSAIDHLTGNILAGEMSLSNYQPHLILQTFEMLRDGAPWEIRRRIAEALPGLFRLDRAGAEHLMETLRLDIDEARGVDIRRRVVEALPSLFEASPLSLPMIIRLLRPRPGDDIYVALATVEACGDIQSLVRQTIEGNLKIPMNNEGSEANTRDAFEQQCRTEIAKLQRQVLIAREGTERESIQFSMALHDLLCAPDTLLISLREGLQSTEKLMQLVAARYIEHLLPSRPLDALELYKVLLQTATHRNVRRAVAKALPRLLQCLNEASLSTRALARAVISGLALDPDIYIRRAVADHAMQVFHIDREFLLILLRHMHKDTDQAIRHRLQPVTLRLAQVWLTWYAETAGLIDAKRSRNKALKPFGE